MHDKLLTPSLAIYVPEHWCLFCPTNQILRASRLDRALALEAAGPKFKSSLRNLVAVAFWASHLISIVSKTKAKQTLYFLTLDIFCPSTMPGLFSLLISTYYLSLASFKEDFPSKNLIFYRKSSPTSFNSSVFPLLITSYLSCT